jgi:small subunit ribosomal protein S20
MPNIKSAKKRMELSRRAADRNRQKRSRIRTAVKKVRQAEDAEAAGVLLKEAVCLLDRATQSRLIHPNRAARIKGQLARHVAELS